MEMVKLYWVAQKYPHKVVQQKLNTNYNEIYFIA